MSPRKFASALARRLGLTVAPPSNRRAAVLSVTALEDRTVPTPVVSITSTANVTEGVPGTGFVLTRTDTTGDLHVSYTLGGTANEYVSPAAFLDGQATTEVWISANQDGEYEGTETISLTLTAGTGYTVGSPGSATIDVFDNDVGISVQKVADVTEGGIGGQFRFTRHGDPSEPLTAYYSIGGTATSNDDYTPLTGWVEFGADVETRDVFLTARRDNLVEGDETVTLTVFGDPLYWYYYDYAPVGDPATLTITDDAPVVSVTAATDAVEGGAAGGFTLTRSGGDPSADLWAWYTVDGTADPYGDYSTLLGSVIFAANFDTASVPVTATPDNLIEGSETVGLALSAWGGYLVGGTGGATLSVIDAVYSSTYDWNGAATVSVTVTHDANQLVWNYRVTNTGFASGITTFAVPAENVALLSGFSSSLGWSGAAASGFATWAGGAPLGVGSSADFSFTTDPLYAAVGGGIISDGTTVRSGSVLGPTGTPLPPGTTTVPPVVTGSITAVRPDGTDAEEGWVSENNDNDNYNFYGDPDTSLDQKADFDELGQVEGEDDLVPIRIGAVTGASAGDLLNLEFASTNIRLWANADKSGGQITPATTFDPLVPHTIYVEGLALSAAVNAESIALRWTGGALAVGPTRMIGALFLTVTKVTGAQNVPGYSRHTYEAIVPGNRAATYGDVTDGLPYLATGDMLVNEGQATQNTLVINWGAGEKVGTYRVNLPNGFGTTRQVNVVKVQLDIEGESNEIKFNNNSTAQLADKVTIHSSTTDTSAIYAGLNVKRLAGPLVGGVLRGQRFIELGFMQVANVTQMHGDYCGFSRVSNLEGARFIDPARDPNDNNSTRNNSPWTYKGYGAKGAQCYEKATDAEFPETFFDTTDTPKLRATDAMVSENEEAFYFALKIDFTIYFSVHTTENVNNSAASYTIRATIPWTWNASGRVVTSYDIGATAPVGTWQRDAQATLSSSADPQKFVEVKTGEIVPTTLIYKPNTNFGELAPGFNDHLNVNTWKRVPAL